MKERTTFTVKWRHLNFFREVFFRDAENVTWCRMKYDIFVPNGQKNAQIKLRQSTPKIGYRTDDISFKFFWQAFTKYGIPNSKQNCTASNDIPRLNYFDPLFLSLHTMNDL